MLKQTYGSVEFDKNIPSSIKIPYMSEWWDISHRVIASCNIRKQTLRSTVFNSNLQLRYVILFITDLGFLRDRVPEFMATLNKHNIPIVVFSAGLGNVIELVLERESLLYDNVKIASNFMNFNEDVCSILVLPILSYFVSVLFIPITLILGPIGWFSIFHHPHVQ